MIARTGPRTSVAQGSSLWSRVLSEEIPGVGAPTRRRIDARSRCLDFSTGILRVAVEAKHARAWLDDGSLAAVESGVDSTTKGAVELALLPVDDLSRPELAPGFGFDSFIASPSNQGALVHAQAFARADAASDTRLFVHGPRSCGKTHLLRALAARLALSRGDVVVLRGAEELSLELVGAISSQQLHGFRTRIGDARALLIDDVQLLAGREATQEELVRVLASLDAAPAVFAAREPADRIQGLTDELGEQIREADPLALSAPEWETRVAIVLDRSRRWDVEPEPEVASFLASSLWPEMDTLDAVLTRLLLRPGSSRPLADLELARRAFQDAPTPVAVSPEHVLATVARHFNLRQRDLRSSVRSRRIAAPRQIAMYLMRQHCGLSYPEIGRRFARHHTTAIHSVRLVGRRLDDDVSLRTGVLLLEKELLRRSEGGG